jgi:2-methylisocitrate lyase-like PEP mutase family enzyme
MNSTQHEKAARFRALHDGPGAFVIPNPWDVGSARVLAGLGFQALATSSAASASAVGRRDGGLTRDEALAHARLIVDATGLPVSADLEKGFGDAPEDVAETIRLAAEVGLVGRTIEDATGNPDSPLYDIRLAVERIAAAAQAAHALQFPFILTARAHNSSMPTRAWTTLSAVFKRSRKLESMCFSLPACLILPQWLQYVRRCRSRSISSRRDAGVANGVRSRPRRLRSHSSPFAG